ncbi:hypothetical protein CBF23_010940 [Marinomonas agarivorans]|nr:hypothetical protein CBF23_010940 [Marinomonas agarivorans]
MGQLRPFFSTLDLQREFEAAAEYLGLKSDDYYGVFTYTDTPNSNNDLAFRPFLYIAEKACWVFSINNIDTYLVVPHYENELNEMINALQPEKKQQTVALIGWLESTAPENRCGGLQLPAVVCNQLLFEPTEALADIPLKLNDGTTKEQRAVNFLAFNYSSIVPDNLTLPKPLRAINYQFYDHDSGRARVEVILTYFNQGIETFYSCGIDVTDQYPFVDFTLRNYLPNNT